MTDISVYRGETKTYSGTITNNGSPLNLTGAVIYFTVRPVDPASALVSDADSGAVIKKNSTSPSQIYVTSVSGGTYELYLVKADTNALTPGVYVFGIEIVLSGATDPVVIDSGYFTIKPDRVRVV